MTDQPGPPSSSAAIPATQSYEALVGETAIAWAQIERMLDVIIAINLAGGRNASGQKPQQSLRGKLLEVRRALRENPILARFVVRAEPILDDIDMHKDERHQLVHGIAETFLSVHPGGAVISRFRYLKHHHEEERCHLTAEELAAIPQTAHRIAWELVALLQQLFDAACPHLHADLPAPYHG